MSAAALCLPGLTRNSRDFEALARHLECVTVGNREHVPLLDEPEVLAAIDRFLMRLRKIEGCD